MSHHILQLDQDDLRDELERIVKKVIQENNFAWVRLDEACKLLNLSKPSIYGLIHRQKLPYHKIGRNLFFSKVELDNFIRGNETGL